MTFLENPLIDYYSIGAQARRKASFRAHVIFLHRDSASRDGMERDDKRFWLQIYKEMKELNLLGKKKQEFLTFLA